MGLMQRARSLIFATGRAPAVSKGEGDVISGPVARVTSPDAGWLPMSWPLNFWQMGRNVIPAGDNSIVEACAWAYIRAIAQLPGHHRRALPNGGIEDVTTSALSRLLRFPNSYETRSDFLTHTVRSLLYDGNSYWLAVRNDCTEAAALHWLNPRQCRVQIEQNSGEVFYSVGENPLLGPEPTGMFGGAWLIPARDILHIKLATPDHPLIGVTWLTALGLELSARGATSMSLNAFFQNASRPSGVLSTDLILDKTQVTELRQRWNEQSQGLAAGGVPILTAGLKWQALGISNHDAQVIEAMRASDKSIAGTFGVPGFLVGVSDTTGWSSTEALMNYWLAGGLGFLIDHIETAMDQFFGLPSDEYVEYETDALLRTDTKTRIEALARGVQVGIYSPNEARVKEGYRRVDGGDEPRVQQQVVPLSWGGFTIQPTPTPVPSPTPASEAAAPPDEAEDEPNEDAMTAPYQITAIDTETLPPLLLQAVKDHMRVDFSGDDTDIALKIAAAIRIYENKTGQIINPTEATWNPAIALTATSYPSPLQPISGFVALDAEEIVVTSQYAVRAASLTSPAHMVRVDGGVFPGGTAFELSLGYSTLADIPADAFMSICRIVGKLYENRESVSPLGLDEVPLFPDDLLVGNWVPRCRSMAKRAQIRTAEVENPFYSRDHAESRTNPVRIQVAVTGREGTVAILAAQGLIDPAQAAAAKRFERLWEVTHKLKFATPQPERTSGGGQGMTFSEVQASARAELSRAKVVLGVHGYRLVSMICGEGYAVRDVTVTRRERDTAHDMLRVYLDQLAVLWSFATKR